ncbi:CoA transferase [Dactylosporangium sp. CA-092794]|uniref:CoA transferase n=1 Tax=Dactylosporangium sp. CA-092794 TaxID=3239929 RepID=UPI003D8E6C10
MLDGLTVTASSNGSAVLIAGGLLRGLGAEVTLIESATGHPLRGGGGFHTWARGLRSVLAEDLESGPAGAAAATDVLLIDELAWELAGRPRARRATVVTVMDVGDAYVDPSVSPDVYASLAEALTGMCHLQQGYRDGPFFLVESTATFGTGVLAATAALLALTPAFAGSPVVRVGHRAGALGMMMFSATVKPDRSPAAMPIDGDPKRITTPVIRFFRAADGWLTVGAVSQSLWAKLCIALDAADLLADPRYFGAPFNITDAQARVDLVERIEQIIGGRTVAEWLRIFRAEGVIAGSLLEPGAALDTDQVRAIGMRVEAEGSDDAITAAPGLPIHAAAMPPVRPARPPRLGEHTSPAPRAGTGRTGRPRTGPPLVNLRVLDFSTLAAGPGVSRILAGLGADVIKIEPSEGDPFRGLAYSFMSVNRGKRSVPANIGDAGDRKRIEDLVRSADVVVHNFRDEIAERFGLTTERIHGLNPTAIVLIVSGYGRNGPDSGLPSIDVNFEAITGGPLVQGGGVEPVGYGGGPSDSGTTLLGTLAVLAALHRRRQTGQGDEAEVSLLATSLYRHAAICLRPDPDWHSMTLGPDPVGPAACHRLYPCSDGWVMVAAVTEVQRRRLESLDATLAGRLHPEPGAGAAELLGAALAARTVDDVVKWAAHNDVTMVQARPLKSFLLDEAAAGGDLAARVDDPSWGELVTLDRLIGFEDAEWRRLGGAPALGSSSLMSISWHDVENAGGMSDSD